MTAATLSSPLGASGVPLRKRPARRVLPGFNLTLGYTLLYLSLIVLIPLSALLFKTFTLSGEQFWAAISSPRVLASYRLTFGASFLAALFNVFFGLLVAWVLVRYTFPGKKIVDALGGSAVRAAHGSGGHLADRLARRKRLDRAVPGAAGHPAGVQAGGCGDRADLHRAAVRGAHGAAGAGRRRERNWKRQPPAWGRRAGRPSLKVIFPTIAPALLTGFAMAFARAIGEYGSVIFIAGNMPMISEITPLIIIGKLEQYDYAGATAVAVVMLCISFILLLVINALQAWQRRRSGASS
jgi:sulfate transport system permease protein